MAAPSIQDSASNAEATGIPMNNPTNATQADIKFTSTTFFTGQPDARRAAISPNNERHTFVFSICQTYILCRLS